MHGAVGVIPTVLWIVLFFIAVVIFGYTLFFADSGERAVVQALLMGAVVSVMISMLLLVFARTTRSMRASAGSTRSQWNGRCDWSTRRSTPSVARCRFRVISTVCRCRRDRGFQPGFGTARSRCHRAAGDRDGRDCVEQMSGRSLERRAGGALRIESTKAAGLADTQTQIDVATFTQWVDAYAQEQTELADFYYRRFRAEFKPAMDAWVATMPLRNPDAPLTPFAMPEYQLEARTESEQLEDEAESFREGTNEHPARHQLCARCRAVRFRTVLCRHEHENAITPVAPVPARLRRRHLHRDGCVEDHVPHQHLEALA